MKETELEPEPEIEIIFEDKKLELRVHCDVLHPVLPDSQHSSWCGCRWSHSLQETEESSSRWQVAGWWSSRHSFLPPLVLSPSTVLFSLASKKLEDGTMTSRALQPGFYLCQNQTISNWDIQTFRSCLTKLSCGTWSPGNCSTLWRCLLNGWPCPLLSGTPTQTTSSLETLWEQSRWPMTVLREQLSLPPTTVSPSPRTARGSKIYQVVEAERMPRRAASTNDLFYDLIWFMI